MIRSEISERNIQKIVREWKRNTPSIVIPINSLPPLATSPSESDIFAPRSFADYIGQEKAKDICQIIVDAAKMEKKPLPNILIFGPYGLGKSTLARLVMERHGEPYRVVDANAVAKLDYFTGNMDIEEVHNLPAEICDQLNTAMDQGNVHIVATTTNPGSLPAAFRSRLRSISLDDYTEKDIRAILRNSLKRKKLPTTGAALVEIAKRSRYNPRHALLEILSFALELTTLSKHATLTVETVRKALEKLDIDEKGLTSLDRKYLSILSSVRPTGLTQICAMLGTDSETIEYEIEPFLLRQGLIERTNRGRLIIEPLDDEDLLEMLQQSVEFTQKKINKKSRS